ncbi:superoxide dismutase [Nocardioides panacis]|uniref:Superoxide dismutase n=1 Tax=Nocardioides panacis TaxID=2849501 RepID=A0A975Y0F8_9ACTN|nr:superoxide dismutase [Nocardioides panacis]QWZ08405.1 superoxide dismutase [Nocardioides panacis]
MTPTALRRSALVLLTALLATLLTAPVAQARPPRDRLPLPDGFQPEGIAISGHRAYFGSRATGAIYTADLRTGTGRVLSKAVGSPSLGMKVDGHGRLFVAGGTGGDGRVVDTRTGKVLRTYQFTDARPTFVNDVVLTPRAAYFTDSTNPELYRVPLGRRLARPKQVTGISLGGAWKQTADLNANGIARTPDGRALLVVQTSTGFLFRVDPATGVARRVHLGGALLTDGDGLLLHRRTLYAVQNQLDRVAVVHLNGAGTRGRLVDTIRSRHFDVPTTIARTGRSLYLPNARFTTPPTSSTTYSAFRVSTR